jgi:hypothetical protein
MMLSRDYEGWILILYKINQPLLLPTKYRPCYMYLSKLDTWFIQFFIINKTTHCNVWWHNLQDFSKDGEGDCNGLVLVDFLMSMKVKAYYGRSSWAKLGQDYNTYSIISPNCGAFNFGFHMWCLGLVKIFIE